MKLVLLAFVLLATPAVSQITPVGPFTGDATEDFESLPAQHGMQCIFPRVMSGRADMCGIIGTAMNVGTNFGISNPLPSHGGLQQGYAGLGGAIITFDEPVQSFGGWFALPNGSGAGGNLATFYDSIGNVIGSHVIQTSPPAHSWIWNGWDAGSGARIASVRLDETDLAFDDLVAVFGDPPTGTFVCNGDGSVHPCPCIFGTQLPPRGCPNATGPGARLAAGGIASLSADSVVLYATDVGSSSLLVFFQGTVLAQGAPTFGDGLRCVGGSVVRLASRGSVQGPVHYPDVADPPLHVRGQIGSPGVRLYQVGYREPAPVCSAVPFNLSNAYQITWTP